MIACGYWLDCIRDSDRCADSRAVRISSSLRTAPIVDHTCSIVAATSATAAERREIAAPSCTDQSGGSSHATLGLWVNRGCGVY